MRKLSLLFLAFFLSFGLLSSGLAQVSLQERSITVTGTGEVFGEPDRAFLEVGVNIVHEELAEATTAADEAMENLIEALIDEGIERRDIRTVGYNVWREERYGRSGEELSPVYRVSNMVRVTVREVERVGELLSASLEAGANAIGSVNYTLSDRSELERAARVLAMEEARERAAQLAGLAEVDLGQVMNIIEVSHGYLPPVPVASRVMMAEGMGGAADVPVASGELAVTVTLQVSFGIPAAAAD